MESHYDVGRGTAHRRGYGRRWRRLRDAYLAEHPLCEVCEANGKLVAADVVDHIQPIRLGGEDEWENLQSLCRSDHAKKTAAEVRRVTGQRVGASEQKGRPQEGGGGNNL